MDKDKKKETTAVDCAVILSGQEMPTADIALFSRLIYLTFSKYEYNDQEKKQFNELKAVEKLGNTHITNQLLSLRQVFLENYHASYEKVAKDLTEKMGDTVIEDRIFRNWLLILATYHAIKDHISVAFTYEGLVTLSASQILIQNSETKKSNEKILPLDSIIYYFKNDKRFLGITRKRFRFLDTTFGPAGIWKSKPEHAYCFLYDEMGVSLS